MGYVIATGNCLACGRLFQFNPHRVPSFRVHGKREPVCGPCMQRVNAERVRKGMEPFQVPADAYEPLDENEL